MKTEKLKPNSKPKSYRKLWISLMAVLGLSFLVLGYYGGEIYRKMPPIPKRVVTTDGQVLFTAQDIKDGQNVWQSMGGQQVGSIWGHGAYVAPDWSGDWLHREAVWLLDNWAGQSGGKSYEQTPAETQAALRERLKHELRVNTYNAETGDLVVSSTRAAAIQAVSSHYTSLFSDDPALSELRKSYAIPANAIKTPERTSRTRRTGRMSRSLIIVRPVRSSSGPSSASSFCWPEWERWSGISRCNAARKK